MRQARICAGHGGVPAGRRQPRSTGQSLVEFALACPVFLLLLVGVGDGGRAFYYQEAVINAARDALRTAVFSQTSGNTACASHSGVEVGHIPTVAGDTLDTGILNAAALESSSNGSASSSAIVGSGTSITVTWHCSGSSAYTNSTAQSTDPASSTSAAVEVDIHYKFSLITPLAGLVFPNTTIVSDVFGRAQY